MAENPPKKKSCGMCWFWANMKGEIKSDIPTQCCPPPPKLRQNGFLQITQKVKEIKKKFRIKVVAKKISYKNGR